jgi:hypothetical protein
VHAQQAELAQVRSQLAHRHLTGLEPLGDVWPQPLLAEAAHGLAQLDVLGCEQRVDVEQVFDPGGSAHDACLHRAGSWIAIGVGDDSLPSTRPGIRVVDYSMPATGTA